MPRRSDIKLTKRVVDALSVEKSDAAFWDRDLAGFGVRVYATGRKVYVVQSRGPWGPKRVTLGRHGEMSCDEARKQAALVIDRIKRGEETGLKPPEAELTVAGLAGRFIARPRRDALQARHREDVPLPDREPRRTGAGRDGARRCRPAEVAALHHALRETPVAANAVAGLLSKMFKMAEAWGLVPAGSNPCRGFRRYRTAGAGAVPDARGVPPPGPRAPRPGGGGEDVGGCGGGDQAPGAHRLQAERDTGLALGRRGPYGGGVET